MLGLTVEREGDEGRTSRPREERLLEERKRDESEGSITKSEDGTGEKQRRNKEHESETKVDNKWYPVERR